MYILQGLFFETQVPIAVTDNSYLKNVPSPLLICLVACHVVQIPQRFYCLRPQQVMRIGRFDVKIIGRRALRIEVSYFRC